CRLRRADRRRAARRGARRAQVFGSAARGAAGARRPVVPRRVVRHLEKKGLSMQTEGSTRTQGAGTAEVAAAAAELVTNGSGEMGADRPDHGRALAPLPARN